MCYTIIIPSYNRAECLRDMTLTMLKKQGIPKNNMIFLDSIFYFLR